MAEYIEKAELIKKLCFETAEWYYSPTIKTIKEFPAADVQPVNHSKWEKKKGYLVCSNCGMTVDTIGYTYEEQEEVFRYCSCCGYRMDGDTECQ